ncbi:MAG: NAD-dependent epimerase/dehydratase family protein, partial [Bacteroidota bacterium]
MASILLTGATGFLGLALARRLAASDQAFRALLREQWVVSELAKLSAHCEIVYGDLNDPNSLLEACAGIDTIIHVAALVSYQSSDRDRLLLVNGEGTANLVNMALEAGVERLIHLSSVAVLNRVSGGPVITLEDRWPAERPNSSYAESKFAAEREVWRGQAEGLSVAVLYPSTMLGVGDWKGQNTSSFWRIATQERHFYPEGTAGFVDLRDVADATLFVLGRNINGDRFLLNGANMSWRELLARVARSIRVSPPTRRMPAWQSALLWPLEGLRARITGSKAFLTKETHRKVQANYHYDGSHYVKESG